MPYANESKQENIPSLNQKVFGFDETGKDIQTPLSAIYDLFGKAASGITNQYNLSESFLAQGSFVPNSLVFDEITEITFNNKDHYGVDMVAFFTLLNANKAEIFLKIKKLDTETVGYFQVSDTVFNEFTTSFTVSVYGTVNIGSLSLDDQCFLELIPHTNPLFSSKADVNGNQLEVFKVANPVAAKDAVNKETFDGTVTPIISRNKTASTLGYLKTPANFDFTELNSPETDYFNYIFEIGYNYDLGGQTITLPENVVLGFKGGKFSNGTIVGNNTKINSELVQIFDSNIILLGSFNLTEIYPEWFGVKKDGTDDSLFLQKTFNFAELTCKKIVFSKGDYLISSNITIKTTGLQSRIILKAEDKVVFKAGYNGDILTIGDASYENTQNGYGFFTLENFNFEHNGFTGATAIRVRSQKNIIFKNIYISGNWNIGVSLKGVYATPTLENVRIQGANTGILALGQVNNILYTRCAFLACQIGFHASPLSGIGLSSGELDTNTFYKCDFEGNVKSILIDSPSGCTNLVINDNHFEGNTGTEIAINNKTTLNVNCNINSITIINNLFYSFNEVLIGNSNSGGNLLNVTFENNHVIYGAENSVKVCTEVGNLAFNVNNIKNNYVNLTRTQVEKPYTAPLLMSKTFEGGIGVMNRYNKQPVLPFGSGDAKGEISDIRFDNENMYVKTYDGGWRYIPLGIIGTYPNRKKSTGRAFAAPTTGTWNKNDTVWNEDVSAGGYIGWVCVTSGSPGTWKGFGAIQP